MKNKNHPSPSTGVSGQAEAAEHNRQQRARRSILQALDRLGIPQLQWPDFVRVYFTDSLQRTEYSQRLIPSLFQPPAFDRLDESADQWRKKANAAWAHHREEFLKRCQMFVGKGLDEEIVTAKSVRGKGKARPARKRGEYSYRTPLRVGRAAFMRRTLERNRCSIPGPRYHGEEGCLHSASDGQLAHQGEAQHVKTGDEHLSGIPEVEVSSYRTRPKGVGRRTRICSRPRLE